MKLRVLAKDSNGVFKEQAGDTDRHNLSKWIDGMKAQGFRLSFTMPLNAKEYTFVPTDSPASDWALSRCPVVGCVGGFIQADSGYNLCTRCGGDGLVRTFSDPRSVIEAIYSGTDQKTFDKLIEDLNL